MSTKLYHMGIRGGIARNTLARANETRDWRMYSDFAHALIRTARRLYANDDFGVDLEQTVYAFDSTTIDLCLALFPWARFRRRKGAVKLHTLLDLRGNIPSFIQITEGKVHDVNALDDLIPEPGSFYILDGAYLDFGRLYVFSQMLAFFVIRAKANFQFRRLYSHPVDRTSGPLVKVTVTSNFSTKLTNKAAGRACRPFLLTTVSSFSILNIQLSFYDPLCLYQFYQRLS